jgi:hypothetical protein
MANQHSNKLTYASPGYKDLTDREATEHERSLRSPDPRRTQAKYRSRLALMDDDRMTVAELGTRLDSFIFPEDTDSRAMKRRLRNRRSF